MSLQIHMPKAPLAHYVAMFWHWEGYHPPHAKERILPHGSMEIVIDLRNHALKMVKPQMQRLDGLVAIGAHSDYYVVDTSRPAHLLAVYFKPGGATPFFGVSAKELNNLRVPLTDLWGLDAHYLHEQLVEANSVQQLFCILERALLHRLKHAKMGRKMVSYALQQFQHNQNIKAVVDDIGISATRFIQVFGDEIGLTPKLYCRIVRFQEALRVIAYEPTSNWADVALRCGYFDQSHMINDFKYLSGITPTLYTPQMAEHRSNLPYFEES